MDIKARFYTNDNGTVDELFNLLNCLEKIEYYILKRNLKSQVEYWEYFCEDTNLLFDAESNLFNVASFNFTTKQFDIKKIDKAKCIEKFTKHNEILGLQTRFDLLNTFVWRPEDGPHTSHITALVGMDKKYYYIVDSSEILSKDKKYEVPFNSEIKRIPQSEAKEALNKLCTIYFICINTKQIEKKCVQNIILLLKAICVEFKQQESKGSVYTGCLAYKKMCDSLRNRNEVEWNKTLETHWDAHLMMARRKILLKSINRYKLFNNEDVLKKCIQCSIDSWNKVKLLIMKNNICKINNFWSRIIACIDDAALKDELMINTIEAFLKRYETESQ